MTNEQPARCECGHGAIAHEEYEGPCVWSKCGCAEYAPAPAACANCGNVHDPDVSADIAEDMK